MELIELNIIFYTYFTFLFLKNLTLKKFDNN